MLNFRLVGRGHSDLGVSWLLSQAEHVFQHCILLAAWPLCTHRVSKWAVVRRSSSTVSCDTRVAPRSLQGFGKADGICKACLWERAQILVLLPGGPLLLIKQKLFITSVLSGAPNHGTEAEGFPHLLPLLICVPALWLLCRRVCAADSPEVDL